MTATRQKSDLAGHPGIPAPFYLKKAPIYGRRLLMDPGIPAPFYLKKAPIYGRRLLMESVAWLDSSN